MKMIPLSRRDLFRSGATAAAVLAAPTLANAALPDHHTKDMPFLMTMADKECMVALCIPATKITHAYCYMLADGRTIYGEHGRCDDGSGWRDCLLGEWDGHIVGRVVTLLRWSGKSWSEMGRGELAG